MENICIFVVEGVKKLKVLVTFAKTMQKKRVKYASQNCHFSYKERRGQRE